MSVCCPPVLTPLPPPCGGDTHAHTQPFSQYSPPHASPDPLRDSQPFPAFCLPDSWHNEAIMIVIWVKRTMEPMTEGEARVFSSPSVSFGSKCPRCAPCSMWTFHKSNVLYLSRYAINTQWRMTDSFLAELRHPLMRINISKYAEWTFTIITVTRKSQESFHWQTKTLCCHPATACPAWPLKQLVS